MLGNLVKSFNISKISDNLDTLNISWNPRDGIHTILSNVNLTSLLSIKPGEQNQSGNILSHGCWCSHIGDEGKRGREPNDELDVICKKWLQARRCARFHKNMCDKKVVEHERIYSAFNNLCKNPKSC